MADMREKVDEFFRAAHTRQRDDGVIICPYCAKPFQPAPEDYSEDTREHECEDCGKKYHMHQVFSVDHVAIPDCELNGQQHEWVAQTSNTGTYRFCKVCDKYGGRA